MSAILPPCMPATKKRKSLGLSRTISCDNILLPSSQLSPKSPSAFEPPSAEDTENNDNFDMDVTVPVNPAATPAKRRQSPMVGDVPSLPSGHILTSKRRLFDLEDSPLGTSHEATMGTNVDEKQKIMQKQMSEGGLQHQPHQHQQSSTSLLGVASRDFLSKPKSSLSQRHPLHHHHHYHHGPHRHHRQTSLGLLRRKSSQHQPVFKVPYPKLALVRDPQLALLSTTFVARKESCPPPSLQLPAAVDTSPTTSPSSSPSKDELQVVPTDCVTPTSPQEVPKNLAARKVRPVFKSPFTPTAERTPAAHDQRQKQTQRLYSAVIRPLAAKKSVKYTDALVVVREDRKLVLIRESIEKVANLRQFHSKTPYVIRDDKVEVFPAQGTEGLEIEDELCLGGWSVMVSEEVLMSDFVFRDREISFCDQPILPLSSMNVGFKLLQKMGWTGGSLGKFRQGRAEPVIPVQRPGKAGLGF